MMSLVTKEFPFMKYRWPFITLSLVLVSLSIYFLATRGLNYGTDFKGGLNLVYEIKTPTVEAELTEVFSEKKLPPLVVQRFGDVSQNIFVIKSDLPEGLQSEFSEPFSQALTAHFGEGKVSLVKEESVGPKVGKELRTKGIYAVMWAWIIMLVYVGFRFDFYFAPGAIIALIHDVLIPLGAFALTQREVNLTVVAAFLTIIGYSINDTIIIFDRIRENIQKYKGQPLVSIIDRSLTQVLVRSVITSLTLFFVVVVLFFQAEGDLQNFAFAMIWGVLAGTYSSLFIASPIYLFLRENGHRFGFKKSPTPKAATR